MAKYGHRAQKRKETNEQGEPVRYFEHVRRVAIVLMDDVGIFDREMIQAALLHDCFEDTTEITPELTEHCFGIDGIDVTRMVLTLSKTPKEGYHKRFLKSTDWRPYVLKGCDRFDNLRSLPATNPEHQEKQIRETVNDYFPLFDRMIELTPKEHLATVQNLRDTIRMVTHRFNIPTQT
jgi:guanosine-3',5'-bis(diphosphate) 3'-pyrophosphohydrolase